MQRIGFEFMITYHSYGQLLLYSFGWQAAAGGRRPGIRRPSGTDAQPAIEGYDPGVGADLYTTNGTTDDYAHARSNALGWTPELSEGIPGNGFVFPDDEALIQYEFEINLPFALDVAKSAPSPRSRSLTWAIRRSRSTWTSRRSTRRSPAIR